MKIFWELAELKNSVFLSRPFCSSPWKSVKVSWAARMGRNFDDYPGFQQIPCYAYYYVIQCSFRFYFILADYSEMGICLKIPWQRMIYIRNLTLKKLLTHSCLEYFKTFQHFNHKFFLFLWLPTILMVFCYQNCSDLLWEKIVLVIEKNFWNSRLSQELAKN